MCVTALATDLQTTCARAAVRRIRAALCTLARRGGGLAVLALATIALTPMTSLVTADTAGGQEQANPQAGAVRELIAIAIPDPDREAIREVYVNRNSFSITYTDTNGNGLFDSADTIDEFTSGRGASSGRGRFSSVINTPTISGHTTGFGSANGGNNWVLRAGTFPKQTDESWDFGDFTYTSKGAIPVPTISGQPAQAKAGAQFNVTVTFSHAIDTTSFRARDLAVGNATWTSPRPADRTNPDKRTFIVAITPTNAGTAVTVQLRENAVYDASALNQNPASNLVTVPVVAPANNNARPTDQRCYTAPTGTVGDAAWNGCAGMLIVTKEELATAISDETYAITGPDGSTSFTLANGGNNVFTGQVTSMMELFSSSDFNGDIGY